MKPDPVRLTWSEPLSAADFEMLLRQAAQCIKPDQPQLVKGPKLARKQPRTAA
jgi:hypothetical protein